MGNQSLSFNSEFNMFKFILFFTFFSVVFTKCKVDSEVKFILDNFTAMAVKKNVDCVVGKGPCDNLGKRLKAEAPRAVNQKRCGSSCTCEQIQTRLVVNKVRSEYNDQWRRVVKHFKK